MRVYRVVRNASIHAILLDLCTFTKAGKGKMGLGVNGHAHRYVLILPAKRVFLLFGVKASLGDDSSLRRSAFNRRKCLVEPPA